MFGTEEVSMNEQQFRESWRRAQLEQMVRNLHSEIANWIVKGVYIKKVADPQTGILQDTLCIELESEPLVEDAPPDRKFLLLKGTFQLTVIGKAEPETKGTKVNGERDEKQKRDSGDSQGVHRNR